MHRADRPSSSRLSSTTLETMDANLKLKVRAGRVACPRARTSIRVDLCTGCTYMRDFQRTAESGPVLYCALPARAWIPETRQPAPHW
jgi:hypothetical protein